MIIDFFNKPFVGAIIGDTHTGKSNLIYHIVDELQKKYNFNLFTCGLKFDIERAMKVYSIDELEKIKNGVIFIDEFADLFDLDDRGKKRQVERTLRFLFHNNNIILLAGLPENFKKFISSKISITFYKQSTFDDFINGSKVKKNILNYHGEERGSSLLNLEKNECLVFDGEHYKKYLIPYLEEKDSKKNNVEILVGKNVDKNVHKNVEAITNEEIKY